MNLRPDIQYANIVTDWIVWFRRRVTQMKDEMKEAAELAARKASQNQEAINECAELINQISRRQAENKAYLDGREQPLEEHKLKFMKNVSENQEAFRRMQELNRLMGFEIVPLAPPATETEPMGN